MAYLGRYTVPSSQSSSPDSILRSVDLPAPFEPAKPILSFLFITAEMLSNSLRAPKAKDMLRISII